AVQPTTVRLYDDATRALRVDVDLPRLLCLNAPTLANDLHFQNPIELNGSTSAFDVRVEAGDAYLDGGINYTVDGVPSTGAGSLAKKGRGTLHMPARSTFQTLYSQGGTVVYPPNSETTLDWIYSTSADAVTIFEEGSRLTLNGRIHVSGGGGLTLSNSVCTMAAGDFVVDASSMTVAGGTFENTSSGWSYTYNTGYLMLDGVAATFDSALIAGFDGSGTNFCGKSLLRITGGAQLTVPKLYAMNGDLEISGEGTRVVCRGDIMGGGGNELACTNNAASRILVTGGIVQLAGDFSVGEAKGSESRLDLFGGVIEMADGKSVTAGNCGNGLIEVAGGLLDASRAYGIMLLPHWRDTSGWTNVKPGWEERGVIRFVGGEARAQQVTGADGRDCQVVFDGGRVTFTNPSSTTVFGGMSVRQIGVNGGEVDVQDRNLTMAGAFTALTNQTPVVVTGAALNTAPAFAKSGSGTLTLVGANAYACGTEAKAGALTATDGVYPGGVGIVGTLTLTDVALAGRVAIDVGADGACDKLIVNGPLDASKLTFDFTDSADALANLKAARIVEASGAITGKPEVTGLPRGFNLSFTETAITV
ncbi:MAG: hypothetical protein ACI4RA_07945, partial [Kiritimatiellia bacterium]